MHNERSVFVTALAWVFIVLTGFATVIAFFQNLMVRTMFTGEMEKVLDSKEGMEQVPQMARFMFDNVELLFLFVLVLCLTMFLTSIGLLRRKNWARWVFIFMLGLGIFWNIAGLFLQSVMMPDMTAVHGAEGVPEQFQSMMGMMRVMSFVIVGGFSVLFLWIIIKLCSERIAKEFR